MCARERERESGREREGERADEGRNVSISQRVRVVANQTSDGENAQHRLRKETQNNKNKEQQKLKGREGKKEHRCAGEEQSSVELHAPACGPTVANTVWLSREPRRMSAIANSNGADSFCGRPSASTMLVKISTNCNRCITACSEAHKKVALGFTPEH